MFEHVDRYAGDPILSLNEAFKSDPRPNKINLSIGIYFDDEGNIPFLPSVRRAELAVVQEAGSRPYLPMEGALNFRVAVQRLLFGADHEALKTQRVATIQSVGSSGALRVGADFIKRYFPTTRMLISDPSWENHRAVFEGAGLPVEMYPYYDAQTGGLRFDAMCDAISRAAKQSIVVLHACCHNPSGVDLTQAQWRQLLPILKERELIPFVDLAYQGFGDSLEDDAFAIRLLADAGMAFFVVNSFSKNMGLYGERCGALSVVCPNSDQAGRVLGQLQATIRRNYSSPPTHGSQVAAKVLTDPALRALWETEVTAMKKRIQAMRKQLHEVLSVKCPERDFGYFLTQRGMFSYTGLNPTQCERLRDEFGVYVVRSGRICVAGLNTHNVEAAANAIAAVM